jgi:hypothetical protein
VDDVDDVHLDNMISGDRSVLLSHRVAVAALPLVKTLVKLLPWLSSQASPADQHTPCEHTCEGDRGGQPLQAGEVGGASPQNVDKDASREGLHPRVYNKFIYEYTKMNVPFKVSQLGRSKYLGMFCLRHFGRVTSCRSCLTHTW